MSTTAEPTSTVTGTKNAGVKNSSTKSPNTKSTGPLSVGEHIIPSLVRRRMSAHSQPPTVFDVVVVGTGPGAATARRLLTQAGRKVAMVNPGQSAQPCTWQDHVGGRVLTQIARSVHYIRTAELPGVHSQVNVDLSEVFASVAAEASDHWENEHWENEGWQGGALPSTPESEQAQGNASFSGATTFLDGQTLAVDQVRLQAKQFVLATGASCSIPALEGLDQVPYLTCSNLWNTPELPKHLLVLGHHTEACEIAQVYSRLGAKVTLIRASSHLLPRREPEAGLVLANVMAREGITIADLPEHPRVEATPTGGVRLVGNTTSFTGSHLMIAVGSRPDTAGLRLDRAGVQVSTSGRVLVDDKLRSVSASHIFAVGHTMGRCAAPHVTQEQARVAARNLLMESRTRHLPLPVVEILPAKWIAEQAPEVAFTDPQVASAGLTEAQAAARYGSKARVAMVPLAAVDRARGSFRTDGFVKLVAAPGLFNTKAMLRLVGITAVGPDAGELITAGTLSMRANLPLSRLANTLALSGTWTEAVRLAASLFFTPQEGLHDRPALPDKNT